MLNIIKKLESSIENTIIIDKGDSGAANYYWIPEGTHLLENVHNVEGPAVKLSDNTANTANPKGTLSIDN